MHHVLLGAGSAVDVSIYSPDGHSLTHKQFWQQICYTATSSFFGNVSFNTRGFF